MFGRYFGDRYFPPRYFAPAESAVEEPSSSPARVGGDGVWWQNPYIRQLIEERERERRAPRVASAFIEFPLPGVRGQARVVPVKGGNLSFPLLEGAVRAARGIAGSGNAIVAASGEAAANVGAVVKGIAAELRIKGEGRAYLPVEGVARLSLRAEGAGRGTHWINAKGHAVLPLPHGTCRAEVVRSAAGHGLFPAPVASVRASVGVAAGGVVAIRPTLKAQADHDPDDEETLIEVLLLAA